MGSTSVERCPFYRGGSAEILVEFLVKRDVESRWLLSPRILEYRLFGCLKVFPCASVECSRARDGAGSSGVQGGARSTCELISHL